MNAISVVPKSKPSGCRVLLVDDDPTLLKLNRFRLEAAGYLVETASSAAEAIMSAKERLPEFIVSDVLMCEHDGVGLAAKVRTEPALAAVPVVLLSSHCESDDAALAQRVGAAHLLTRTPDVGAEFDVIRSVLDCHCLTPAADTAVYDRVLQRNASQISRLLGKAQDAEDRYRTLFRLANDSIALLTPGGVILEANERWEKLVGTQPQDLVGRHFLEFVTKGATAASLEDFRRLIAAGAGRSEAVSLRRSNGDTVQVEFSVSLVDVAGDHLVVAIGRDVTEEVAARAALSAAEERYRTLLERIPDVIWTGDETGRMVFATPNFQKLTGRTLAEYGAATAEERAEWIHPDERADAAAALLAFAVDGCAFDLEYRLCHSDGRWIWVRNRSTARYERDGSKYIEGMLSDITERKILEESLCQAQKIEAIGQLTGGIAHDFNNILSAILANSHFLLESLDADDKRRDDAEEVRVAAERGAALTRQLLAFSRRQVLQPSVVDLNTAVAALQKMLCRLIGEDITLTVSPGAALGTVRVDVGQLEQVVMNLVLNARDAMPQGGQIRIETTNLELEAGLSSERSELAPGRYVMLSVSDTGSGMDPETQRHLFEPFFTTKPLGKGTGLGLSTCYGIVKQSGGHICVQSELGLGSVFKIFLPRIDSAQAKVALPAPFELSGSETILLVEDDTRLRSAVRRILRQHGYEVLIAASAAEARGVASTHGRPIDLVLTDVVMPGQSGPDLARDVHAALGCKVLFMSGYTDHAALQAGVFEPGMSFIQKPFAPDALAKKLREVLDG
jgi:two-component system cell cycle sensor histidine kinase/response regulator CckA